MSNNQSNSPARSAATSPWPALKTAAAWLARHLIRAAALFLAMNDRVGYAMRDELAGQEDEHEAKHD